VHGLGGVEAGLVWVVREGRRNGGIKLSIFLAVGGPGRSEWEQEDDRTKVVRECREGRRGAMREMARCYPGFYATTQ